jgi:hypothetical protein
MSAPYQTAWMNQWAQPCVEIKQQYHTLEIVISPLLFLVLFAVSLASLKNSSKTKKPKFREIAKAKRTSDNSLQCT